MANIHFIWSGPPKGEISYTTPNAITKACWESHNVHFWCQENYLHAFGHVLDSKIVIRPCTLMNDIVPGYLTHPNAKSYAEAQGILSYLIASRAFAAAKDLLSLIILHTYGGYYFDTTTFIALGGPELLSLVPDPDRPKVPQISKEAATPVQVLLQTAYSIFEGWDRSMGTGELSDDDDDDNVFIKRVPLIDAWAMASPAGDKSFELMMMSYISRCNRMGLNPSGFPLNLDRVSGTEIMLEPPNKDRNTLLGSLIIRSIYDGLIAIACGMNETRFPNFCWKTIERPAEYHETLGRFYVPALGINKRYSNTWRQEAMPRAGT